MTKFNRHSPYLANLKTRAPLSKCGSTKKTYHVVLDIQGSGLQFKVGDSVGILAQNDPLLVQSLLDKMQKQGSEIIEDPRSHQMMPLRDFLSSKVNFMRLNASLITETTTPLQELCNQFAPMLPRFYSVASSPRLHPDEVHLTVALLQFIHDNEPRFGVASHFLCHLAQENNTPIPLYVQSSPHFTLPDDPNTPIIMIGPGTGIAPFRGFMQERMEQGAKGKNWLFFGERHREFDFFYEHFWTSLLGSNQLRLDLAFSRDQAEKCYVQHKMLENAADIWAWLEEGTILYVCGDASRMAKDVEQTLHHIIHTQGNMPEESAKAYLKSLRAQKRYRLDVY